MLLLNVSNCFLTCAEINFIILALKVINPLHPEALKQKRLISFLWVSSLFERWKVEKLPSFWCAKVVEFPFFLFFKDQIDHRAAVLLSFLPSSPSAVQQMWYQKVAIKFGDFSLLSFFFCLAAVTEAKSKASSTQKQSIYFNKGSL